MLSESSESRQLLLFNLNFQMSSVQTKRNFKCFHEVYAGLALVLPFTIVPTLLMLAALEFTEVIVCLKGF